jgi:putative PEP-CTERM system histidine kinase
VAAFLAYAVFAAVLAFRSSRSSLTICFFAAAALTSVWGGFAALSAGELISDRLPETLAALRDGGWYAIVLAVLYYIGQERKQWRVTATITAALVAINILFVALQLDAGVIAGVRLDSRVTGLAELCVGFVLLENMMRNLDQDRFWSAKHLGIGLGAVLSFQALVLTPELLTNTVPAAMAVARPLVYLLVMPLFVVSAVRSPGLALRVHSSRRIVFQTTALIAIGVVLQGTAIAAYYLRTRGGDNGTVLAILLAFGALVGFAVALASRTVRSRIGTFINENFFSYKYDYRLEWQNFIRAVSRWDDDNVPLGVLRTMAELVDSPGGGLWVWRESWNRFMPVAHWSLNCDLSPIAADDELLQAFNDESCAYLDLWVEDAGRSAQGWRQRFPEAWLVVPFRYRSSVAGFALINQPRSERKLNWEDKDLISLVALQLAAYLVQQETAQALMDARQLEQFNKRFAFILHDTKNAIGQLTLLVRNAEQFGHEEEFRKDMIATLRNSVEKLQALLASLTGGPVAGAAPAATPASVDLEKIAAGFAQERLRMGFNLQVETDGPAVARLGDSRAFIGVLEHVVANALEATPPGTPVSLRIAHSGDSVFLTVQDQGPGMSENFIANDLFRPLKSTKKTGFGIGAFQAREIMRDLGGDVEIRSKLGEGTAVTLILPAFAPEREIVSA